MDVFSELKQASLESVETDPTFDSQKAGRFWRNHADDVARVMMASEVQTLAKIDTDKKHVEVASPQSIYAVGEVRASFFDESTFQSVMGTNWVLCDGRNVSGSRFQTTTGNTSIPDLRGIFPRGKDNGRGLNPDGDLALGFQQGQAYISHTHTINAQSGNSAFPGPGEAWANTINNGGTVQSNSWNGENAGGNEIRPKSVTINYFIKIN